MRDGKRATGNNGHPMSIAMSIAGVLGVALIAGSLAGCAPGTSIYGPRTSVFVDPSRYDLYDCAQLGEARSSVLKRVNELERLMAKAKAGAAGELVSAVAYESDYAKERANLDLIDDTRRRNNCGELPAAPVPQNAPRRHR
jgi:hypothetical protein